MDKVLIIGDFNFHVDDSTSKVATDFLNITESFNFVQHVSGPTHIAGHTLDLVFSYGLIIDNVQQEDFLVSDHKCVLFDVSCNTDLLPRNHMSRRRIIDQSSTESFAALFDPNVLSNCNDVDVFVQLFNEQCSSILDIVAPFKTKKISAKSSPWINESIRSFRRNCRKIERLWKTTKLEVHRLHLKELLICLNEMIRGARTTYFANLISSNKRNPKVLFETINPLVSPTAPQVPVLSNSDCNNFLKFFLNKVNDIKANIPSSLDHPIISVSSCTTITSFSPVSIEDITKLLHKIKPSCGPLDNPPPVFLNVFNSIGPQL